MKMNLPNKITIFRIICVIAIIILSIIEYYFHILSPILPTFILLTGTYTWTRVIILILFIIASISDAIDGYIARSKNMITTFGKFLDPIADKLLINEVSIILACFKEIPLYIPLIFIFRDTFVDGIRLICAKKNIVIAAGFTGKLKTTFQMISIISYLALYPIAENLLIIRIALLVLINLAALFSLISGIEYFVKNKKVFLEE